MSVIVGNAEGPEAAAALARAGEEAGLRGLPLHIFEHILLETPVAASEATQQGRFVASTEKGLDQVAERFRASGLQVETHLVSSQQGSSSFTNDVIEIAESVAATLIVIGIRKRSKVGKLVLGSRAQDILLRADCAVLAVKADEDREGH